MNRLSEIILEPFQLAGDGDESNTVVIGVSGGPDSVCLLHLMHRMRESLKINIVVAHVNHGLRGRESDEDENFVRKLCFKLGVPLEVARVDVKEEAEERGITIEEAGRLMRYAFFDAVAKKHEPDETWKYAVILTAHNANDNAETLLQRIIRGTSTTGLAGIPLARIGEADILIMRPMLHVRKEEILEALAAEKLEYRTDSSNLKAGYARNKIRNKLIPYMDELMSSDVVKSLGRLVQHAGLDREFFDEIIEELFNEHANVETHDREEEKIYRLLFPTEVFTKTHLAVSHRLVIEALSAVGLDADYTMAHIDAIMGLILQGETGKRIDLPHGFEVGIDYDEVYFKPPGDGEEASPDELSLSLDDVRQTPAGLEFYDGLGRHYFFDFYPDPGLINPAAGDMEKYPVAKRDDVFFVDLDRLAADTDRLTLRARRVGDRINPVGMEGSKKIQDIMVDLKIPRVERDQLPLLAIGSEVVWFPGYRKSRLYAVDDRTMRILRVEMTVE